MNKILSILLVLICIISCSCVSAMDTTLTDFQNYFRSMNSLEKQKIAQKKVCLQETDFAYPQAIYHNKTQIPNVFIDEAIIQNTELRYKISCYLMNKLDLGIYFKIENYEEFVKSNKELIARCVYLLCHIKHGKIHRQYELGGNKLLKDSLIQEELNKVIEKLKEENSYYIY